MIKIFRKVRQKMLEQSKIKSYFVYAIGEIVLVVIGILIALQINNWNENRKQQSEFNNILKTIYKDLKTDTI